MAFWSRPRPFLEPELEAWQFAAWELLGNRLGGLVSLRRTPLVEPTSEFFPPTEATGHDRVQHIFDHVRRLSGVANRRCCLVAQEPEPDLRVSDVAPLVRSGPAALGTFSNSDVPIVTYDPALADDPGALIAVLAHELAHLILSDWPDLPGGRLVNERATDLATVLMGFGLFGANAAFTFRRYADPISSGWCSSRRGYLEEREWCFALAVLLELKGQDEVVALRRLKPHLASDLKSAHRSLQRRPALIENIRASL